jgi:hypothetical protein
MGRAARAVDVARRLVASLVEPDLRLAWLFGSFAWGDGDAASDLDLMLLLDRPPGYRHASRVRVADVLGGPVPGGPRFADVDRMSFAAFAEEAAAGGRAARLVRAVVLHDPGGAWGDLRSAALAAHRAPAARAERFVRTRAFVGSERGAFAAAADRDPALAALHARQALEGAMYALLELAEERGSPAHYPAVARRALAAVGAPRLHRAVLRGLVGRPTPGSVARSRAALGTLFAWVRDAVEDPAVVRVADPEHVQWARFTCGEDVIEEVDEKLAAGARRGRWTALQFYLDGKLVVQTTLSLTTVLRARRCDPGRRESWAQFCALLREDEPELFDLWAGALRLGADPAAAAAADRLAGELLAIGEQHLGAEGMAGSVAGSADEV